MRRINNKTQCWNWLGSKDRKGYGQVRINKKIQYVHRLMATLCFKFHTYETKTWVLHKCDNPSCFNPEHLFLGDRQSNIADMLRKGRQKKPRYEPTERDLFVLNLHHRGFSDAKIARLLSISRSYSQHIRSKFNKSYGHLARRGNVSAQIETILQRSN